MQDAGLALAKAPARLGENGIELTLRFLIATHGIRPVKDRIARQILDGFAAAGIEVASQTIEITRTPGRSQNARPT